MMFKIGDHVTWRSQANGSMRTKTGTVVAIVPAGQMPPRLNAQTYTAADISGFQRNHESYLISVEGKTVKAKSHLYWPRVTHLQAVE